jgi:hypothetical protein
MNIVASRRRADVALIDAFARGIFKDSEFQGRVHRIDAGWLAESADGRTLGSHSTELAAVRAVLDAARRS